MHIRTSVVKRPGTSVPSRYCIKNENVTVLAFSSTGGTEYPVNPVLDPYSLYDFHDAENADGISESSYKNGIYSLAWNVTEFVILDE